MTYYIEPVDRDLLPTGQDWLFIEEPDGDIRFILARDAEAIVLPTCAIAALMTKIGEHTIQQLAQAS